MNEIARSKSSVRAGPAGLTGPAAFEPTGNPFVDTGLYAMLARARALRRDDPPRALSGQLLSEVMGDGRWLARANRRLNSFFMVCLNSALVNSSTNRRMKSNRGYLDPQDEGWQHYLEVLFKLRDEVLSLPMSAPASLPATLQRNCEACGQRPATWAIERIGRDFFPFAGSLGNDAQALPSASRSPRICAFCLLAIQWLPLGAQMYNGRLACFQFSDPEFSALAVEQSFAETSRRLDAAASDEGVSVAGSGEGARRAAISLLDQMHRLQEESGLESLPPHLALNIWSFSNAASAPECEIAEIPHRALQFLWDAARYCRDELREMLESEEPKRPHTHLLNRLARGRDYPGLYPHAHRLASKPLYELYQTRILRRSRAALAAAERMAAAVCERFSGEKERKRRRRLETLLKESPRRAKDSGARRELRAICAEMAAAGELALDRYVELFPALDLAVLDERSPADFWREKGRAVRASGEGWDVFWFYLHCAARREAPAKPDRVFTVESEESEESEENEGSDLAMFTHPRIRTFARHVFELYMEERGGGRRGLEWIGNNLLERFRRNEVTTSTLREWFIRLAAVRPGYENEDWDSLCRDEEGREATDELRFQMQLEIANLYRRALDENLTGV